MVASVSFVAPAVHGTAPAFGLLVVSCGSSARDRGPAPLLGIPGVGNPIRERRAKVGGAGGAAGLLGVRAKPAAPSATLSPVSRRAPGVVSGR